MIRTAIVDDEPQVRQTLTEYFEKLSAEMAEPITVVTYANGDDLVEGYDGSFDLICLDIEMPGSDGIATARQIRALDPSVILIFITNLAQLAIRGYEVQARDFIVKPVNYYAFALKIRSILQEIAARQSRTIGISTADGMVAFQSEDLFYIEVQGHKLYYHTKAGVLEQKAALRDVEEKLSSLPFCRCNQSYLVNLRQVKAVRKDEVLVGTDWLKISRSRRNEFLRAVSEYMGGIL